MRHVFALAAIPIVVTGAALIASLAGVDGPALTVVLVVAMIGALITARAIDVGRPAHGGHDRPETPAKAVASGPPGKRQVLALLAIPITTVGLTIGGRLAGIDGYGLIVAAVVVAVLVALAIDRPWAA